MSTSFNRFDKLKSEIHESGIIHALSIGNAHHQIKDPTFHLLRKRVLIALELTEKYIGNRTSSSQLYDGGLEWPDLEETMDPIDPELHSPRLLGEAH